MKLLFLSNVHPNPLSPGKGTFNGALVRALSSQHDVHVVCPVSWVDRCRQRNVELPNSPVSLQSGVTASYPTFWYPPKLHRASYDRWLDWSIRRRVERDLKTFRPDAVLSYWAHPDGAAALKIARRLRIPAITMVGGSDILLLGREGARRRVILRTLLASDAVIAVSDDIAKQIIADGVPAAKVHVVRRGVDQDIFHPGDKQAARHKLGLPLEGRIIIGVGRHVPVKDWPMVISACDMLKLRQQDVRCYLLGDGPERPHLEQLVDRYELKNDVVFRGSQSQSDLADWYRAADLVVLSSLSEGVPNVLLEAIASGTPFVATNVGGIPEIANLACHRLVPPGHADLLADAVQDRLNATETNVASLLPPMTWNESALQVTDIFQRCRSGVAGCASASSINQTAETGATSGTQIRKTDITGETTSHVRDPELVSASAAAPFTEGSVR